MPDIEELLRRRSDLSTFLVHLTRDGNGMTAREKLQNILKERLLRRGAPLGAASHVAMQRETDEPRFYESQRVVCFTEAPLEQAWMLCQSIPQRQMRFKPYGIVVTKTWARMKGVNPVWYLDITPSGHDWLITAVDNIVNGSVNKSHFRDDIFRLTPFIETMGRMGEESSHKPKEFSWEREWRLAGKDLRLANSGLVAVFVPEEDMEAFAVDLEAYGKPWVAGLHLLDPRWSLERMIAALAGISGDLSGPFPPYPLPRV